MLLTVKRGLVVLWALSSTLIFLSNLGDGLRGLGILPASFPFSSGNLDAVVQVTQIYGTPPALAGLLFMSVVLWDALTSVLFWRAAKHSLRFSSGDYTSTDVAFAVGLALWAALIVADEVFLSFQVGGFEATHRMIFVSLLVSLLAIRLLPNE